MVRRSARRPSESPFRVPRARFVPAQSRFVTFSALGRGFSGVVGYSPQTGERRRILPQDVQTIMTRFIGSARVRGLVRSGIVVALAIALLAGLSAPAHAQITVGGNGSNTTDSTSYTGNQTLTKNGSNTVTLTAASSYTGITTINGGTLALQKPSGRLYSTGGFFGLANGVTINSGATLRTWDWNYGAGKALSELASDEGGIFVNGGRIVFDDSFTANRGFTVGAGGVTLETTAGNTFTKSPWSNPSRPSSISLAPQQNLWVKPAWHEPLLRVCDCREGHPQWLGAASS